MACGCIKKEYRFALTSLDKQTLAYQDLSIWMDGPNYTIPEEYTIGVTLPTTSTPSYITLDPRSISLITTVELQGTTSPQDLPDGIYCFQVDENSKNAGWCGETFIRYAAVTYQLECCRDSILASLAPESSLTIISTLNFYIESTKINAELNKPIKSQEFYKLAKDLCAQYNCSC